MSRAPRPRARRRRLGDLPPEVGVPVPASAAPVEVTGITHDSRAVLPGDVYAALPGFVTHGARFAADAAAAGAAAVLTDPDGAEACRATGLPVLVVAQPRAHLGALSAWVYGDPGEDLLLVGITGTNGKTTTSYLVEAGLRAGGHRTGLIGTTGTRIGDEAVPTVRTTPEATDVHALLAVMRERGVTAVTMEVSSHALVLGRVDGLVFDVAVFTNLSRDHMDFHPDMADYFAAKARLFTSERSRTAAVGIDDEWGRRLAATANVPVTTYGLDDAAQWHPVGVRRHVTGAQTIEVAGPGGAAVTLDIRLPGAFNVANALAAVAAVDLAGIDLAAAAAGMAAVDVPGRMEPVDRGQPFATLVDYAHSPDAVERVLAVARGVADGRVLAVLGCGGDRDREKRPLMGEVAARLADVLVVTDDNPRGEDPAAIRATMLLGVDDVPQAERAEVVEIGDRREAIRYAVAAARTGDVVLVLGKGHEQGQEVAGVHHPFDDRAVLAQALEEVRS